MLSLKTAELKFLLKLLGCEGYRGSITGLSPSSNTPVAERDRICESLAAKGFVEFDREIARFKLAPPGRTLLMLDTTSLPVTPDELKVLKACKGTITPSQLTVPPTARQPLIETLAQRKMLTITKNTIKEVRLTAQGAKFLREDYEPVGYFPVANATMLGYYVKFLRADPSFIQSLPAK